MRRSLLLQNTPPEWNVRVLTEDDFYQYCDEGGIIVRDVSLNVAQRLGKREKLRTTRDEIVGPRLESAAIWTGMPRRARERAIGMAIRGSEPSIKTGLGRGLLPMRCKTPRCIQ